MTTTATAARRGLDPDLWVRRGCAAVVAGVAAYASYQHQRQFAALGGADSVSAALWPLSVDGLVVLASLGVLKIGPGASRRARWSGRLAFTLGVVVSLAANIAAAPVLAWRPILVAGWPPLALLLAVELLAHRSTPAEITETSETPRETMFAGETGPARAEDATDAQFARPVAPGRGDGGTASPERDEQIVTLAVADRRGRSSVKHGAEAVMWQHYQAERAQGRTPTGAELDRVAGTNNYGRSVLARWRRTGRIPVAVHAPRGVGAARAETAGQSAVDGHRRVDDGKGEVRVDTA